MFIQHWKYLWGEKGNVYVVYCICKYVYGNSNSNPLCITSITVLDGPMLIFLENWTSNFLGEAFLLPYEWFLGGIVGILSFDLEVWI